METVGADFTVKRALSRSWSAFFAKHGRLTEIQRRGIPILMEGKNAVLASATASGKTEAAIAPIIERALAAGWPSPSVLYISPTRALVNDLYARLEAPLAYLGIEVVRRTGDHPDWTSEANAQVIITTPESLDSLLCRFPSRLATIEAVILDEIHLLDGTTRGDQLKGLLQRLRFIRKGPFQCAALSATIQDPARIAEAYLGADAEVVTAPGTRAIRSVILRSEMESLSTVTARLNADGIQKALFFCNSRREAEELARALQQTPDTPPTVVHHASLDKALREEVEAAVRQARSIYCTATMTLELGIDIGDVDAVVLFGPPPDVDSLLQRVGRGNRRKHDETVAYCLARDTWEEVSFETLLRLAREGILPPGRTAPFASVVVQQFLSYAFQKQRKGVSLGRFETLARSVGYDSPVRPILDHLVGERLLSLDRHDLYFPGEKLSPLAKRGLIHSTFETPKEGAQVTDARSGKVIGQTSASGDSFLLAGKRWEILRRAGGAITAKPVEGREHNTAFTAKRAAPQRPWLAAHLRTTLTKDGSKLPTGKIANGRHIIIHCLGEAHGKLLATALREAGKQCVDEGGRALLFTQEPTTADLRSARRHLPAATAAVAAATARTMPLGRYFSGLPAQVQREEAPRHFQNDEVDQILATGELEFWPTPELEALWAKCAPSRRAKSTLPTSI